VQGSASSRPVRVAIFYPADPAGHIPSGVDTFIRGILKWAPPSLSYTLFGASSDPAARPLHVEQTIEGRHGPYRFVPVVAADASSTRQLVPLFVRFIAGLLRHRKRDALRSADVLDFQRIELVSLFLHDRRPKTLTFHQDMAVLRDPSCDIGWRWAPWLYEFIEKRLLRSLAIVYCVRESAVHRYRKELPKLADRFHFLPTWVDPDVFMPVAEHDRQRLRAELRTRLGAPLDAPVVIWVGRMDRQKNPLLMLETIAIAASSLPELRVLLVGDGGLRSDVEARVAQEDLRGRVHLEGVLRPAQLATLFNAVDVFLLSSAYEGMPIALLEALGSGVPAVSTEVGEVRRVIVDGQSGTIATEQTAGSLAAALLRTLAIAPELSGEGCVAAVQEYLPATVLRVFYENHLRLAAEIDVSSRKK
jgi:glycosyltransferase involved in cell wall biosynthesis